MNFTPNSDEAPEVFVRWVITETNGRELEAMPEQVTVPPAPKVLRNRPQFEG